MKKISLIVIAFLLLIIIIINIIFNKDFFSSCFIGVLNGLALGKTLRMLKDNQ